LAAGDAACWLHLLLLRKVANCCLLLLPLLQLLQQALHNPNLRAEAAGVQGCLAKSHEAQSAAACRRRETSCTFLVCCRSYQLRAAAAGAVQKNLIYIHRLLLQLGQAVSAAPHQAEHGCIGCSCCALQNMVYLGRVYQLAIFNHFCC
jgi:hypothetical protein